MKAKGVDCFMLMGTALSMRGGQKLPEMGRPLLQEVLTTIVNLTLTMQYFDVVDVKNMEVEFGGLLNQHWIDPRLGANIKTRKMAVAGQIWKPKITNVNGHNTICYNEDTIFWRGFGDEGNVLLSEKVQIASTCTKNFQNFPFDVQYCELKFGSYRFPIEEVSIFWDETPADVFFDVNSNEFLIHNITSYIEVDVRPSGNFSVAVIQIILRRQNKHYLICTVIPCIVLIVLNYMSMWFDVRKRISRFNVQFFSFCGLLYFYYFSTCVLQPVPYLKALDFFTAMSLSFSIFSILESFFIDCLCSSEERQFHLKRQACSKEYSKYVYWLEFGMKMTYPVFYTFFVTLFCAIFVE